jgi:hypothetical protein
MPVSNRPLHGHALVAQDGCKRAYRRVLGRGDSNGYRRSLRPGTARFSLDPGDGA